MKQLFLTIVCFGCLALSTHSLNAASLHAIIVADTLDKNIGRSVAFDLENIQAEVRNIAFYTELELKETIFKDDQVLPSQLLQAIDQLEINEDDVIFFYFSGHGFRTEKKGETPWPNLYFCSVDQGIEFDWIGKKLENYHPRLTIMMADACNNFIPKPIAPPLMRKSIIRESLIKDNYSKLFLECKGILMITSSLAGEFSFATKSGGLFTRAFLQHFHSALEGHSEADWFSILEHTSDQIGRRQHPDFRMYFED